MSDNEPKSGREIGVQSWSDPFRDRECIKFSVKRDGDCKRGAIFTLNNESLDHLEEVLPAMEYPIHPLENLLFPFEPEKPTMADILHGLLALARKREEDNPEDFKFFRKTYSSDHFLKEFRTIRLGGPRQTGNTTALIECTRMFVSPIVITSFVTQADLIVSRVPDLKGRVFSLHQARTALRGYSADALLVDCNNLCAKDGHYEEAMAVARACLAVNANAWIILTA